MWYFPSKAVQFLFVSKTPIWQGILVGVLVEFFALLLWIQPVHRTMYGMFIVLLSLVSFVTSDFGGLFIGMILGLLGGSLALSWTPVTGKTKRQQKWLMKSRGERPVLVAAGTAVEAPNRTIVLDGPKVEEPQTIGLAEGIFEAEQFPMIGEIGSEIDMYGWEVPPPETAEAEPIIDVTETAAEPVAEADLDLTDVESRSERTGAPADAKAE